MVCVERELKDNSVPISIPWTRPSSTRLGCSMPPPVWSWTLPQMGCSQLLCTCSSASHPSQVAQFLPISNTHLLSSNLKPFSFVLSLHVLVRRNSLAFLHSPFRHWKAAIRAPQSLLFARLNNPNLQPFLMG